MTTLEEAERGILGWLVDHRQRDHRITMLFHDNSRREMVPGQFLTAGVLTEAVWSLLRKGLVYLDFNTSAGSNSTLFLTAKGRLAIDEAKLNPDNLPAYLEHISSKVSRLSEEAGIYLRESLKCYEAECFTASTMMLGVATESVFYEAALPFSEWLTGKSGAELRRALETPGRAYIQKFVEFQKRIAVSKSLLPPQLQQNIDLNVNSILELIRLARNEAGHPTGIQVQREDAYVHLVLFPNLANRLYDLRDFCRVPSA